MFNINGIEWQIFLVSPFHYTLYRSDGSLSIGACDNVDKIIYINKELRRPQLKRVLCHELTHAVIFSYNIELNLEQEELFADLLATYGQEIIDITNELFHQIKTNRESLI